MSGSKNRLSGCKASSGSARNDICDALVLR
jgi:hypothetical protein